MSRRVIVRRAVELPDDAAIERARRVPELGPRILFFSGGTALRGLSRVLKRYTHNSIHLITPFDSGGSSARLREAFDMLSVGDLRNRLMALADESVLGNPEIYELFAFRLPRDADPPELGRRLQAMIDGRDELVAAVPSPLRRIVRTHLRILAERMPPGFDLRGASIGNLVLAGGYLSNQRDIESVIFLFSRLVEVRGTVRPIVDADDLHLAAELADGSVVVGQHLLTGKEVPPLESPIVDLYLVRKGAAGPQRADVGLDPAVRTLIEQADVVCYPMGSFYTSLVANLLPRGVASAVASVDAPKVYVPNRGGDPEQIGLDLAGATRRLLDHLRRDAGADTPARRLLDMVLVDPEAPPAPTAGELAAVAKLGPEVVEVRLVSEESAPLVDAGLLADVLLSLG